MELGEALHTQRACREFRPDPVAPEVLVRVLEAATRAPSAGNSQPWRFVVVTDATRRSEIAALAGRAWAGGGKAWSAANLPGGLHAAVDRSASGGLAAAPVLVVVGADTTAIPAPSIESSIWPAVQNLLLAATAEGLGSALTTLATAYGDELRALVGLPADVAPMAVIPLGRPARPLQPGRRRPVSEVASAETYGRPLL